jgi:hypothetical protein
MMISMKCEEVYKIFTCRAKYIQCCTAHSWHSQQRRAYLGSANNSTYIFSYVVRLHSVLRRFYWSFLNETVTQNVRKTINWFFFKEPHRTLICIFAIMTMNLLKCSYLKNKTKICEVSLYHNLTPIFKPYLYRARTKLTSPTFTSNCRKTSYVLFILRPISAETFCKSFWFIHAIKKWCFGVHFKVFTSKIRPWHRPFSCSFRTPNSRRTTNIMWSAVRRVASQHYNQFRIFSFHFHF